MNCKGIRYCEQISGDSCMWCRKKDYSDIGFPVDDPKKCDPSKGFKLIKDKSQCCEVGHTSYQSKCYREQPILSYGAVYDCSTASGCSGYPNPWWRINGGCNDKTHSCFCMSEGNCHAETQATMNQGHGIEVWESGGCTNYHSKIHDNGITPKNHYYCSGGKWAKCSTASCQPKNTYYINEDCLVNKGCGTNKWNDGMGEIRFMPSLKGNSWCEWPPSV